MPDEHLESFLIAAELGHGPELDLHEVGDVSSGVHTLDLFLNQQFMAGERAVKIIHGRGAGVMRRAVHEHLAQVPFVEAFRDSRNLPEVLGVTVAVLASRHSTV